MNVREKEKGFSVVEAILIVVILAVIGVVGWLVYKDHNKSTSPDNNNLVKNSSNTETTFNYNGWLSYTSTVGNFTFKYPSSGWTLSDDNSPGEIPSGEVILQENPGVGLSTDGNTYGITISVEDNNPLYGGTPDELGPYYPGIITTLPNGLQMWLSKDSTDGLCNGNFLLLVSNNHNSKLLSNGKLLFYQGTFCFTTGSQDATTSISYKQAINSNEVKISKEILSSFVFQ